MDKRIQDALAEAPDLVKYPEPEELAAEALETVESFIMTTRRAAATPRRFDDRTEQRADKRPVNRLAWSMMIRYAAWAKATGTERRFKSWRDTDLIPYGPDDEAVWAERARISRLDVGEWVVETRKELTRLLGLAAVGRYRLKEKPYGSIVWKLIRDIECLDEAEEQWRQDVKNVKGDPQPIDPNDMDWDAVERMKL